MAGRVALEISPNSLALDPGGPAAVLTIVVHNVGRVVDQFMLSVTGLDPTWYTLSPTSVSLFPGDQAEAEVSLRVPEGAAGGSLHFQIVASSRDNPTDTDAVDATLEVAILGGVELALSPERVTARRRATYQVTTRNRGNADRRIQLSATDPGAELAFRFSAEEQVLLAGGEATVQLEVRPRDGSLVGPAKDHDFRVAARSGDDPLAQPLAEAAGQLAYQPPLAFLAGVSPKARRLALLALPLLVAAAIAIWLLTAPGRRGPAPPISPTPFPTLLAAAGAPAPSGGGASAGGTPTPTSAGASGTPTPAGTPAIVRFGVDLAAVDPPPHLPLSWNVYGASSIVVATPGETPGPPRPFRIMEQQEFTLVTKDSSGTSSRVVTVYVFRPPLITSFAANPTVVPLGGAIVLSWSTDRATQVFLDDQPVAVVSGSLTIKPSATHEYVLRADNVVGEATEKITVAVGPALTSTATVSPTASATRTSTTTATPSRTSTVTPTATRTNTPTPTRTPTPTPTRTATRTFTATSTVTLTPCPTMIPATINGQQSFNSGPPSMTVSWASGSGCAPYTGTVVAQYNWAPAATYAISAASGSLTDSPPPVTTSTCAMPGRMASIVYVLSLKDSSGQNVSATSTPVNWMDNCIF